MDVAPEKARKRREQAARDARVQRWAEDSGNAALMGRELPPAEVLAADQRITAWARQLNKAGLEGDMDVLRARAYLDMLLGKNSRPRQDTASRTPLGRTPLGAGRPGGPDAAGPDGPGGAGPGGGSGPGGPENPAGACGRGPASVIPAGFAGRNTLTLPLTTLLGLADRPAEIPGIGPIDPWLARDLARAAAANPKTTWCVTVTDEQGHAIGTAAPGPYPPGVGKPDKPGPPDGRDPPGGTSDTQGRGSPSPPPDGMGRPADTAPGGCAPRPADRTT